MISSVNNLVKVATSPFVIVALDYDNINTALEFVNNIDPLDCRLKVGNEMFTKYGFKFIKLLCNLGFDVFLDLKYHDIPCTVARSVTAAAEIGVWMVNVHASGGIQMMEAARKALEIYGDEAPLLVAVTVLTSINEFDLKYLGINDMISSHVKRLALLSKKCGFDGVVCSVNEIKNLKKVCGIEFKVITPGIRFIDSDVNEHKYTMSPSEAVKAGVDYVVIGRPITGVKNQALMLKQINLSITKSRNQINIY
ncbi:Orotidine 5'-phosphate decarboxylase [Candidatus Providencia siddallii]|uniref:Orotidine 5'-phosphate decarboxylase n=1 Tax=Candidatus Providencia siddallii TaxID=1715285 RepID=A0A0M6W7Q1_9GAMM|nr:Orotidine 5'-phosphate decarboxylase [Candidatus Providencia siddallii]